MSREILLLVDALAREKNVDKNVVFGALEQALASATKKRYRDDVDVRVAIDQATGDYKSFRRWQVLPDETPMESPAHQIALSEAVKVKPDIKVEEFIEEPLEPVEARRRDFEAVVAYVFHRQHPVQLMAHRRAIIHAHAARLVDVDAQQPSAGGALDGCQLVSHAGHGHFQ